MNPEDRRTFIARLGAAALAGGALTSALNAQEKPVEHGPEPKKEIVPGSPSPAFSRAVRCGGMVYVSGVLPQVPGKTDLVGEDFEAQARQAMENLKAAVEASGSKMERVVKCGAFLTEAADFPVFNKVYMKYFPADPPARSTVIVKALVLAGARIEIDCIAMA
ncbi:MAG TPA: RidA family protein [Phycisphaerae bacterium]|nr:RidA family protein [Phycisphaerae bacterium]